MRELLCVLAILILFGTVTLAGPNKPPAEPGAEELNAEVWLLFAHLLTGEEIECALETPFGDYPPADGYMEWPGGPSPMPFESWIFAYGHCWFTICPRTPLFRDEGEWEARFDSNWQRLDSYGLTKDGSFRNGKFFSDLRITIHNDSLGCEMNSDGCTTDDGLESSGGFSGGLCGLEFKEPRWGEPYRLRDASGNATDWVLKEFKIDLCPSNCCSIESPLGYTCEDGIEMTRAECRRRFTADPSASDFDFQRHSVCRMDGTCL